MMTNSLASFLVTHLKGLLLLSKRAAVGLVRSKFLYYMPGNSREQTLDACLRKKLRGSVQSSILLWIAQFCSGLHFKMIVRLSRI